MGKRKAKQNKNRNAKVPKEAVEEPVAVAVTEPAFEAVEESLEESTVQESLRETVEESTSESVESSGLPFFAPEDDSLYPYHGDKKVPLTSYTHSFVERAKWTDEEYTFVSFTEGRTGRIIRCWENMIAKVGFTHNIQEFYLECCGMFPAMKNSDDVLWTETEMKILKRHTKGDFYPRWAIFEDLLRYGAEKSWFECERKYTLKLQNHLHLELTQEDVSDVQAHMDKYAGDISRVAKELKLSEQTVQDWYEGLELHEEDPNFIAKEDRMYNSNVSLGTPGVAKRTVAERKQAADTNWFESEDLALLQSIKKVGVKDFDHEEFRKNTPNKTAKQRKRRYSTLSATGTFGENLQALEKDYISEDLWTGPRRYRDESTPWTQAENKAFFSLLALYASNENEQVEWDTISFYVASRSPEHCKNHFDNLKKLWLNM